MSALREESRTVGLPDLSSPRSVHTTFHICRFGGLVGREEGRNGRGIQRGIRRACRGLRAPAAGGAGGQVTPVLGQVLRGSAPGPQHQERQVPSRGQAWGPGDS